MSADRAEMTQPVFKADDALNAKNMVYLLRKEGYAPSWVDWLETVAVRIESLVQAERTEERAS